MITGLNHLHSSFRYLVLLFIVLAIVDAIIGLTSGKSYKKQSKLFALLGLITSHIQLVVGLALYFMGGRGLNVILTAEGFMKSSELRFYAVEHISMMLIAIVLVTVGYSKAKRIESSKKKFRTILIFYGIALVLIFIMIPWPFMRSFGSWM
jgi:signal transduction histidine kinase